MRRSELIKFIPSRQVHRWLVAWVIEIGLCEFVGMRHYVARFEWRGNISMPHYYWYFQGGLLLLLAILGLLGQERRSWLTFIALGTAAGYLISFVEFHTALALELRSIASITKAPGAITL